jgi:hypothetical protein
MRLSQVGFADLRNMGLSPVRMNREKLWIP